MQSSKKQQKILSVLKQKGFSLLEVLVVVGIMSIIGLGVSTLMVNANKQAKSVEKRTEFTSLVNLLLGAFNSSATCIAAFGGVGAQSIKDLPYEDLVLNLGDAEIKKGTYGEMNIKRFAVTNKVSFGGVGQYKVYIALNAERGAGEMGGDLYQQFELVMNADPTTGEIQGCLGSANEYWIQGKAANNIAYLKGNVGVGTDEPSTLFDVNGTAQAVSFHYRSDERLKENIQSLNLSLEKILKLKGVKFDWKDHSLGSQIGFVAQEVEKVFPEVVQTNSVNGLKSVAYGNLVAPLVEAIKAQQKIILQQQKEIEEIKNYLRNNHQ